MHYTYMYKLVWMLWMVVPVDWQNNHLLMWYWSEAVHPSLLDMTSALA